MRKLTCVGNKWQTLHTWQSHYVLPRGVAGIPNRQLRHSREASPLKAVDNMVIECENRVATMGLKSSSKQARSEWSRSLGRDWAAKERHENYQAYAERVGLFSKVPKNGKLLSHLGTRTSYRRSAQTFSDSELIKDSAAERLRVCEFPRTSLTSCRRRAELTGQQQCRTSVTVKYGGEAVKATQGLGQRVSRRRPASTKKPVEAVLASPESFGRHLETLPIAKSFILLADISAKMATRDEGIAGLWQVWGQRHIGDIPGLPPCDAVSMLDAAIKIGVDHSIGTDLLLALYDRVVGQNRSQTEEEILEANACLTVLRSLCYLHKPVASAAPTFRRVMENACGIVETFTVGQLHDLLTLVKQFEAHLQEGTASLETATNLQACTHGQRYSGTEERRKDPVLRNKQGFYEDDEAVDESSAAMNEKHDKQTIEGIRALVSRQANTLFLPEILEKLTPYERLFDANAGTRLADKCGGGLLSFLHGSDKRPVDGRTTAVAALSTSELHELYTWKCLHYVTAETFSKLTVQQWLLILGAVIKLNRRFPISTRTRRHLFVACRDKTLTISSAGHYHLLLQGLLTAYHTELKRPMDANPEWITAKGEILYVYRSVCDRMGACSDLPDLSTPEIVSIVECVASLWRGVGDAAVDLHVKLINKLLNVLNNRLESPEKSPTPHHICQILQALSKTDTATPLVSPILGHIRHRLFSIDQLPSDSGSTAFTSQRRRSPLSTNDSGRTDKTPLIPNSYYAPVDPATSLSVSPSPYYIFGGSPLSVAEPSKLHTRPTIPKKSLAMRWPAGGNVEDSHLGASAHFISPAKSLHLLYTLLLCELCTVDLANHLLRFASRAPVWLLNNDSRQTIGAKHVEVCLRLGDGRAGETGIYGALDQDVLKVLELIREARGIDLSIHSDSIASFQLRQILKLKGLKVCRKMVGPYPLRLVCDVPRRKAIECLQREHLEYSFRGVTYTVSFDQKLRHLKAMGWNVYLVPFDVWDQLGTFAKKREYVQNVVLPDMALL